MNIPTISIASIAPSSDKVTNLSVRNPGMRMANLSNLVGQPSQAMNPPRYGYTGNCSGLTDQLYDAVKGECVANPCSDFDIYDFNNNVCVPPNNVCAFKDGLGYNRTSGGCVKMDWSTPITPPTDAIPTKYGPCEFGNVWVEEPFSAVPGCAHSVPAVNGICPQGMNKINETQCQVPMLQCPAGFLNVENVCHPDPKYLQCPAGFKNVDNNCVADSPCKSGETYGWAEVGKYTGKMICCTNDAYTKGDEACYDPTTSSGPGKSLVGNDKTTTYLLYGAGALAILGIAYFAMKKGK
jgi:hypothetical protein